MIDSMELSSYVVNILKKLLGKNLCEGAVNFLLQQESIFQGVFRSLLSS